MKISYSIKLKCWLTYNSRIRTWKVYSMPSSSAIFHIMVTFIHGRIIMATLVYCGVGPLLIQGHACMAAQINKQEATSVCLCHSVATKNRVILKALCSSQTVLVNKPKDKWR